MKKILLYLLGAVAVLALASCAKEPEELRDPAQGGQPVPVTFSLELGNAMTKAVPEASAFDDAAGTFQLYAAAFSKNTGTLMASSRVGGTGYQPVAEIAAKSASVTLTLSRNQEYRVVFFAMRADAYDVEFGDGNLARFSFKRNLKANDASLDAFFASVDVTSSSTNYDVSMKRPFAQVNVLATNTDVPEGQQTFSSSMSVLAPVSFDLFAGAAVSGEEEIVFASNAINAEAVGKYKSTHTWIGMNYVLVPASGNVTINAFAESGMAEAIRIGRIPVTVNGRTNLVGDIYSLSEYHFNLGIDPVFGDGNDLNGGIGSQGEETVITLADGKTYTAESPLILNAVKSVSVLVNGDDFSTVEAGAGGAKVTASSSNPAVATAEVRDGAVLITPKSNGTATVTIFTPAYTKTDYAAQTFEIPIKVEGMDTPPLPVSSDTIVFGDLGLENSTQYKDPFTQGNMSVLFGAGGNDGKFYTTGNGIRIYGDGWVTVSSSKTITKIEYTFDPTEQKDGDVVKTFVPDEATFGSVDAGSYDLATQTWTGSAKSVKLTRATGTGHWRLQKIVAYYDDGGGETPPPVTATLTNAEIRAATVDAEITSANPSYRDATITSASGTWTGNIAKHADGLKFLQLRNKKGAYITSPLFSSAISKVEVTLTSEDVSLADRTLHAVPPTTTVPTADEAYPASLWASEYGCVRTGAEKGATVAIDFAEGSNVKQFMLIVEGGATYIDHIDVYY